MKGLGLFLIAVVLGTLFLPFAILFVAFDSVFNLMGDIALSIDMAGNVFLRRPMNYWLITDAGYKFGNRKETVSSVLGKNQRDNTLMPIGKWIAKVLDTIDPGHCKESIDKMV